MPLPDSFLSLLLAVLLVACLMTVVSRKYYPKVALTLANEAPEDTTKTPVEVVPATSSPPVLATSPLSSQEKGDTKATMPDVPAAEIDPAAAKQSFDAFLVLDVEATCMPGTDFNYANEIIASHLHTQYALSI